MNKLIEIYKKHNIWDFGLTRLYPENLLEREYDVENEVPYAFSIGNEFNYFGGQNWRSLLFSLVNFLQSSYPKSSDELCSFRVDWSKVEIFSTEIICKNSDLIDFGLYLNFNHTALHYLWLIQDLLRFFNINLNQCSLLVCKAIAMENSDVKKEIKDEIVSQFKQYVSSNSHYNFESVNKYVEALNKVLVESNSSYNDLYLMDCKHLSNYKSQLFSNLIKKRRSYWTPSQVNSAKKVANLLTDFMGELDLEMRKNPGNFKGADSSGSLIV